ncbi:MAG: DUF192 domain-containing protein [Candidatus Hadarchaeia archaeon]
MKLLHMETGKVMADKVELADSFWSRFRGLMFRRNFGEGEALVFEIPEGRKFGVHTFFVFFPIDLIYLNRDMKVVDLKCGLTPWSTYSPKEESRFLVEIPSGTVQRYGLERGHKLRLKENN